jgi:intracellular sulfur oxidation DsrE/DsrF family protein
MNKISDDLLSTIYDSTYQEDNEEVREGIRNLIAHYEATKGMETEVATLKYGINHIRNHFNKSRSQCIGYHRRFTLNVCNSTLPPSTNDKQE